MAKTSKQFDDTQLLPFAKWMRGNLLRRGYSVQRVADDVGMHVSHLHKILKSHLPQYADYQRPGYEKTVLIGELFSDVPGALESAGYTKTEVSEGQSAKCSRAASIPSTRVLLEHFANNLDEAEELMLGLLRHAYYGRSIDAAPNAIGKKQEK